MRRACLALALLLVALSARSDTRTVSVLNRALANSLYCQLAGCEMSGDLTVGNGGTGTAQRIVTVDSGSGASASASYDLRRNSILKGQLGVSGAAGQLITGDASDDLGLVSTQAINFSAGSFALHGRLTPTEIRFNVASAQGSVTKTLTESSATAFTAITVANSSACSGFVIYTVFAQDATNTQAKSGILHFSAVANSSGTVTAATISDVNTLNPVTSGTLTNTMTSTTGANLHTLLANAASSLTQTALNIKHKTYITSGTCTVTPQ